MADPSTTASDSSGGFSARLFEGEKTISEQDIYVSLTYDELDAKKTMDRVKSAKAGAVVLFAGKPSLLPLLPCSSPCSLTDIVQ